MTLSRSFPLAGFLLATFTAMGCSVFGGGYAKTACTVVKIADEICLSVVLKDGTVVKLDKHDLESAALSAQTRNPAPAGSAK